MKQRRMDYDVLRVLAMLGVIYQHVAVEAVRVLDHSHLWELSNFLISLAVPAVPLFFMISGALLMGDKQTRDLDRLFRHRLPRIVVPLATFTLVTLLIVLIRQSPAAAAEMARNLFHDPATVAYWYLYALIPMYLISPFLRILAEKMTNQHWNYMIALWALFTVGLTTLRFFVSEPLQNVLTEHWTLNLNFIGGYLGYFLLGAYLERLERIPSRKILAGASLVLLAVIVLGTRWDTYARGEYSDHFTNYLAVFTMLLSACLFLLAKSCLRGKPSQGKLLPLLAGNSFCVYLLHTMVIGFAKEFWQARFGISTPMTVSLHLLFYLGIAVLCILISVLLSSLPGVCYLFTGQRYGSACQTSNLQALFRRTE